jgi:signal transduction histidine kinase
LPPGRGQRRLAGAILAFLLAALFVTTPFAAIPLPGSEPVLPAYAAAVLVNELITASLLLALFSTARARPILILAIGYLFSGLMAIPWLLTFPGVLGPNGLLEAGLQSTASIAALRRVGFPLLVLAYALSSEAGPAIARNVHVPACPVVLGSVGAVVAAVGALTWLVLVGEGLLPQWMADSRQTTAAWHYVPAIAACLCLAALSLLWRRQRRSVLDLWLAVVLCSLLIEILLLAALSSGRFSVGWWAGRFYGFVSASIVLIVLLAETTTLHARLVRSMAAERRAREARLTTMEALSASVAHEVNQPLASMVTNADAGLRWLDKAPADLGEARAALRRIVRDGHHAGRVVDSIRAMFGKGASGRLPLNINPLILDVLERWRGETQLDGVVVQTQLGAGLPLILGDPIQLQQALSNLVTNAIDALRAVDKRCRVLRVTSGWADAGGVLVSVEDSGVGLDPAHKERIFEPFFTTKQDGMGMGLMFCRSVVEAHGGRLWVDDNVPRGAVFRLTLPGDDRSRIRSGQAP